MKHHLAVGVVNINLCSLNLSIFQLEYLFRVQLVKLFYKYGSVVTAQYEYKKAIFVSPKTQTS
mgnify:CR=1 FL=1